MVCELEYMNMCPPPPSPNYRVCYAIGLEKVKFLEPLAVVYFRPLQKVSSRIFIYLWLADTRQNELNGQALYESGFSDCSIHRWMPSNFRWAWWMEQRLACEWYDETIKNKTTRRWRQCDVLGRINWQSVGPFRVPDDLKMNAQSYTRFLQDNFIPWYHKQRPVSFKKKIIFMQDNAPSHAACYRLSSWKSLVLKMRN